tara:strand:- start:261 stop:911 length:651 start_codon:yes stop_codon:yes gene_type:complete
MLYFDIETVKGDGAYVESVIEEIRNNTKPPANIKKQETIDKWYQEKHDIEVNKKIDKLALDGATNKIVSIAYAIDDSEIKAIYGEDEKAILNDFAAMLKENLIMNICGHNIINFDLKVLKQRYMINQINVVRSFSTHFDAKPWNAAVFDTMHRWDTNNFISMDKLCRIFGLDGKGDTTGADVAEMYAKGKLDDIAEYNKHDVELVREIHKRMRVVY